MAKTYKMLFTAGGNYRQGAVFSGEDVDPITLKGWIKMGAIEETTDAVSDPDDEMAYLFPSEEAAKKAAKKATLAAPDSPALTTGQPGGAPVVNAQAPAAQPQGPMAQGQRK